MIRSPGGRDATTRQKPLELPGAQGTLPQRLQRRITKGDPPLEPAGGADPTNTWIRASGVQNRDRRLSGVVSAR